MRQEHAVSSFLTHERVMQNNEGDKVRASRDKRLKRVEIGQRSR